MKRAIYKYSIPERDYFTITMPGDSEILCVQNQNGKAQVWALVNTETKTVEDRYFRHAGTGHTISDENLKYIGTYQAFNGSFVGHLFEVL